MTFVGWLQILVFFALDRRGHQAARRLHVPRLRGRAAAARRASSAASSAASIGCAASTRGRSRPGSEYTVALLAFSAFGVLVTYAIQRLQRRPAAATRSTSARVEPTLAFNTAASFTTNTNWQAYRGESTMSYLTQMAGLAWHNFTSAAAGIGVALALARGLTRAAGPDGAKTLGNFWVDLIRAHRSTCCCRSASSSRWCSSRRA